MYTYSEKSWKLYYFIFCLFNSNFIRGFIYWSQFFYMLAHNILWNDITNKLIDHSDSLLITFRNLIGSRSFRFHRDQTEFLTFFIISPLKKDGSFPMGANHSNRNELLDLVFRYGMGPNRSSDFLLIYY